MGLPTQQVAKEFMTVRVFAILGAVGLGGPCDAQQCEEDAMTVKGELGQVLEAVQGLGARVDHMGARMDHMGAQISHMGARMDRLEMWMERLGAEFIRTQTRLETEIQEGFQQVNGRIDRLNDTMTMMGSALHRTNERVEGLDARVRVLEERQPHL
jgi:DNA anti-recombination protein RmuC